MTGPEYAGADAGARGIPQMMPAPDFPAHPIGRVYTLAEFDADTYDVMAKIDGGHGPRPQLGCPAGRGTGCGADELGVTPAGRRSGPGAGA